MKQIVGVLLVVVVVVVPYWAQATDWSQGGELLEEALVSEQEGESSNVALLTNTPTASPTLLLTMFPTPTATPTLGLTVFPTPTATPTLVSTVNPTPTATVTGMAATTTPTSTPTVAPGGHKILLPFLKN